MEAFIQSFLRIRKMGLLKMQFSDLGIKFVH